MGSGVYLGAVGWWLMDCSVGEGFMQRCTRKAPTDDGALAALL